MLLLLIYIFLPTQNCKANTSIDVLNNKTLSSDIAIKEGNIVMIFYTDTISSKTHNDMEIYNTSRLDDFIENTRKGKKDKIRIVKYAKDKTHMWVNKLDDLKYDGKNILDVAYDTYTNPNTFVPSEPFVFSEIIRKDYEYGLWYGVCNKDNYASLISFLKDSIMDNKQ